MSDEEYQEMLKKTIRDLRDMADLTSEPYHTPEPVTPYVFDWDNIEKGLNEWEANR